MSKELIVRLREAAAQRVASTAMIGADDLIAAADALEIATAGMNAYCDELGSCRKAAGFGSADDPMAQEGFGAFSDPLCVAAKEFWGMADNHLPAGTHLYARPVLSRELTDKVIERLFDESAFQENEMRDAADYFAHEIERYLKGEGE